MLIVGELINASRKAIAGAIEAQDSDFIKKAAQDDYCMNYLQAYRDNRFEF